ncbi:MAG: (d)CMP kinase, partial [Pseudohongiellaceae bacterium]
SPLKPAEDAVTLDSTDLTIDEVVNQILKLFLK